jgi:hypothetical protein
VPRAERRGENPYREGDCQAQFVWHVSCVVLQFNSHVAPAVVLPVVVAAVVVAAPGPKRADWQVDPWELQIIMQLVTVEVCASRIFAAANVPVAIALIASAAKTIVKPRMTTLRGSRTFRAS